MQPCLQQSGAGTGEEQPSLKLSSNVFCCSQSPLNSLFVGCIGLGNTEHDEGFLESSDSHAGVYW